MKFNSRSSILVLALLLGSCGSDEDAGNSPADFVIFGGDFLPNGPALPPLSGENIIPITVNGDLCSKNSYINKPCVSVRVCVPETNDCREVSDILLDTGSYGLRIFKSALSGLTLEPSKSGRGILTECVQFGTGSDWGPVAMADIILGGEPSVKVPIQLIDASFSRGLKYCEGADISAAQAGFNGILGVGPMTADCDLICSIRSQNRMYYACEGGNCTGTTVPLSDQVQNPVAHLPRDNNGVIIQLPSVPVGGAPSANGYLILGIGTRENNQPSKVTTYPADSITGEILTTFMGKDYWSFLDTGSNAAGIPDFENPDLKDCGGNSGGVYCPTSLLTLETILSGYSGTPSKSISFQIGNPNQLQSRNHRVFANYGASSSDFILWGLPFHLGRNVFIGLAEKTSALGTGPYFAF